MMHPGTAECKLLLNQYEGCLIKGFKLNRMKRILLALSLMTTLTAAQAEWTVINTAPEEAHYFAPETIQKNDHKVKVWVLSDYAEKLSGGYHSVKTYYEFDCQQEQARSHTMLLYSGAMASGNVVGAHHDKAKVWFSYPDYSIFEYIANVVCEE